MEVLAVMDINMSSTVLKKKDVVNMGCDTIRNEFKETGEKRILVIDDESSVVELVRAALQLEGHTVFCASDGVSALGMIDAQRFDLVISDLKMPGIGGIDVFQHCLNSQPDVAERFLVLTGDLMSFETRQFLVKHEIPYILKPFDIRSLVEMVNRLSGEESL
jgi:CheY-like chemotaxis protein